MDSGQGWRYPVLFLLLLGFLSGSSEACFRDHSCSLNELRGCGECPPNTNSTAIARMMVGRAGINHKCYIGESIVATTFTDIRRLGDSYLMLLEMPGVGIRDVKVEVDPAGSLLSISGLSREKEQPRFMWERGARIKLFARKFLLPSHVNSRSISHQLEHGLLRVTLPILPGETSSPGEQSHPVELPAESRHDLCSVERVEEVVQPQALIGLNKPGCDLGPDPDSCQVALPMPLVDVEWRDEEGVMVVEMPGVESAEVELECKPGRLRGIKPYEISPVERGTPGCIVSVRGIVEDEDHGELVRVERGGSRRKVFERSLYFSPGTLVADENPAYNLSNGLLKVPLRRAAPAAGMWETTVGFVASCFDQLYNMV